MDLKVYRKQPMYGTINEIPVRVILPTHVSFTLVVVGFHVNYDITCRQPHYTTRMCYNQALRHQGLNFHSLSCKQEKWCWVTELSCGVFKLSSATLTAPWARAQPSDPSGGGGGSRTLKRSCNDFIPLPSRGTPVSAICNVVFPTSLEAFSAKTGTSLNGGP